MRIRNNHRGDTIVEVIIAIAIISLILTASFVAANRNTQTTQDTQEHNQALQLVQGQIEMLRAQGVSGLGAGLCFQPDATPGTTTAQCTVGTTPAYVLSIKLNPDTINFPDTYTVDATWGSVLGETDDVNMSYRP